MIRSIVRSQRGRIHHSTRRHLERNALQISTSFTSPGSFLNSSLTTFRLSYVPIVLCSEELSRFARLIRPLGDLLVSTPQIVFQKEATSCAEPGKYHQKYHRHDVSRRILRTEKVGTSDVPDLAQNVDDCSSDRFLLRRVVQDAGGPTVYQAVTGEATADKEEGCEIPRRLVESANRDGKADDRGAHGGDDVQTPFVFLVAVHRQSKRDCSSQ